MWTQRLSCEPPPLPGKADGCHPGPTDTRGLCSLGLQCGGGDPRGLPHLPAVLRSSREGQQCLPICSPRRPGPVGEKRLCMGGLAWP